MAEDIVTIKISCPNCGKEEERDLPKKFEGKIMCRKCKSLMEVLLRDGRLLSIKSAEL